MEDDKRKERETIEIIGRKEWNARAAAFRHPMTVPVREVYYTETDTKCCTTKKECKQIVKGLQNYHMDLKGMEDIHYNFLIGGDGNVYEGRGWLSAGPKYPKNYKIPQSMTGKCIEIAFIGRYKDDEPTKEMKEAAYSLVMYGLDNKLVVAEENPEAAEEETKQDSENNEPEENNISDPV